MYYIDLTWIIDWTWNIFFSVAQKLDAGAEYLSIDGAIRVISDDFSISLLNPDSELYRYKADKYASMVSKRIF